MENHQISLIYTQEKMTKFLNSGAWHLIGDSIEEWYKEWNKEWNYI